MLVLYKSTRQETRPQHSLSRCDVLTNATISTRISERQFNRYVTTQLRAHRLSVFTHSNEHAVTHYAQLHWYRTADQ